jgi:hypothetical protein
MSSNPLASLREIKRVLRQRVVLVLTTPLLAGTTRPEPEFLLRSYLTSVIERVPVGVS